MTSPTPPSSAVAAPGVPVTVTPKLNPQMTWDARKKILQAINTWRISGKIAVRTPQESGSASINWSQQGSQYQVSLMGPLGANGMKLAGGPGHVVMTTANGKHFSAPSAEQLLSKQWGYHIPISSLRYWVRGLPVTGVPFNARYDQSNRITSLVQSGWNVQFAGYALQGGVELPMKVFATSQAMDAKIMIYNWQIG